jgi:ketosteroid isomerase-like protein
MLERQQARTYAEQWIAAWNAHDLNAIMKLYSPEVSFTAPTVIERWHKPDGLLVGQEALREHFQRGLELAPNLHFELLDVLIGVDGITIVYRRETGTLVADVVELDDEYLGEEVHAYYGSTPL